jgi:hypothetical protein
VQRGNREHAHVCDHDEDRRAARGVCPPRRRRRPHDVRVLRIHAQPTETAPPFLFPCPSSGTLGARWRRCRTAAAHAPPVLWASRCGRDCKGRMNSPDRLRSVPNGSAALKSMATSAAHCWRSRHPQILRRRSRQNDDCASACLLLRSWTFRRATKIPTGRCDIRATSPTSMRPAESACGRQDSPRGGQGL